VLGVFGWVGGIHIAFLFSCMACGKD